MKKSFKSATKDVLKDAEEPLHYRDITEKSLKNNLIETNGKTPWATINVQLSVDIGNEDSDVYRSKPGFYSLKNPDKFKCSEFMIEKRELANKIVEYMDKL
ncbi:MAG: winged helix-turn-helix domain-containing protein [Patescibacteria group bacterium]|nr:winged helix-turn-helix domain-containing protein [Patescibacteria group bacterium]